MAPFLDLPVEQVLETELFSSERCILTRLADSSLIFSVLPVWGIDRNRQSFMHFSSVQRDFCFFEFTRRQFREGRPANDRLNGSDLLSFTHWNEPSGRFALRLAHRSVISQQNMSKEDIIFYFFTTYVPAFGIPLSILLSQDDFIFNENDLKSFFEESLNISVRHI